MYADCLFVLFMYMCCVVRLREVRRELLLLALLDDGVQRLHAARQRLGCLYVHDYMHAYVRVYIYIYIYICISIIIVIISSIIMHYVTGASCCLCVVICLELLLNGCLSFGSASASSSARAMGRILGIACERMFVCCCVDVLSVLLFVLVCFMIFVYNIKRYIT